MPKYFVLGKDASIFNDASSQFTVTSTDKKNPNVFNGDEPSKRMAIAISHGHIVEVEAPASEPGPSKPLNKMTVEELTSYYQENYTVSDADLVAFKKLRKEEMVKFLEEE